MACVIRRGLRLGEQTLRHSLEPSQHIVISVALPRSLAARDLLIEFNCNGVVNAGSAPVNFVIFYFSVRGVS